MPTEAIIDEQFLDVKLRGTFNQLLAVRRNVPRLPHFVYASSNAVYLCGPWGEACCLPIGETHLLEGGTVYGAGKIEVKKPYLTFW